MAQQINMNDMNNEYGSSPQSSMNRYPQTRQNTGYPQGQGYYVDPQSGAVRSNPFETAMQPAESLSTYIAKTYLWMFAGLLLTFFVALGMNLTGMTYRLLTRGGYAVLIAVTIAEFVCVITMSAAIRKISAGVAGIFFFVYAALTGVTFSIYFALFDLDILIASFGATALFFGGMAAVSLIFKMQLDTIRPFLFGGLILLIVFGLLSLIFNLGAFNTVICYIGIAVFLGYTAYDTSKIRANYAMYAGNTELLKKASVFSALQLYLDFVNLFLYILRILSRNRSRN